MIYQQLEQGSVAWVEARLGIPTASQFHRLITPKTRKVSAGAGTYRNELLAEWATGQSMDDDLSGFMQRGIGMEDQAVAFYEGIRDISTRPGGFCLRDDARAGCSPDRLIDQGGLELKVPSAPVHVGYALELRSPQTTKYYPQIQGSMWITETQWWDFLSFHPTLPPALVRYERDQGFIDVLEEIVLRFCRELDEGKQALLDMGYHPTLEVG